MKIGVVIVTYNRLKLLKETLKAYENQVKIPEYIIVVNNNSNDGTKEFLYEWEKSNKKMNKYIIQLDSNTGGSGGFYRGLEKAMKLDAEWIWVGDDDAFPQEEAFYRMENNLKGKEDLNIVAVCGKVLNFGKIDLEHRRRIKKGVLNLREVLVDINEYEKKWFYIDEFSYVGTMMKKEVLEKVGITKKDYFIYYDDTEHSLRMREKGSIVCFPDVEINHDVGMKKNNICWKNYYGYRNLLNTYNERFSKKYYIYKKNKLKIKSILLKDKKHAKMIKDAINDCEKKNFGINSNYRPGV